MFPGELDVPAYLVVNAGLLCLHLALGGFCFFASCLFNESRLSVALGAGVPVLFFLIRMLANMGGRLEKLKYATVFTLFDPTGLFRGDGAAYAGAAVLLALVCFALPQGAYVTSGAMAKDVAAHLTFTFLFWPETYLYTPLNAALWTIAVEMQFYLLFPFLARAAQKKPAITLPVMAVLGWGWRLGVAHFAQDTGMLINQMPAYLDVYALGMLGAMAYLRMRRAWEHMRPARRRALIWACAAGFAVGVAVVLAILRAQSTASAAGQRALHLSQMEMRLPLTLVLLGAMLCAAHMPRVLQKVLDNRLMRFLSAISMNLYIWHQILSVQMRVAWFPDANTLHITPVQQRAYSLLCFSVAILVAMAATYGLEQPAARAVNAWIKRLGRKRNHEGPQIGNPCPPADSLFVRPQAGRARADREFRRRAGGSDGTDS